MRRAQYSRYSPVPHEVIEAVEFELPRLTADQALVKVLAAPINPSDLVTLMGRYGSLPPLPAVGGNEGVGRVVEVGSDVRNVAAGQLVLLPAGAGTWTTHLLATAARLVPLPETADPLQLAMLTVNPPTALLLLQDFVGLSAGDWVMQNAANSAVGTYLVQTAKTRALRTVNVVRRESAVDVVRALGADVVVVDGDDLADRVAEATGGASIRLGIDAVAGFATERMARALAEGATVVNYGAMSGEACILSPASLVFRDIALRGFWLARWFRHATPAQQGAIFGELTKLIATGVLRARVQATFDLEHIKEAVAAAAAGEREGKILLVPNG